MLIWTIVLYLMKLEVTEHENLVNIVNLGAARSVRNNQSDKFKCFSELLRYFPFAVFTADVMNP